MRTHMYVNWCINGSRQRMLSVGIRRRRPRGKAVLKDWKDETNIPRLHLIFLIYSYSLSITVISHLTALAHLLIHAVRTRRHDISRVCTLYQLSKRVKCEYIQDISICLQSFSSLFSVLVLLYPLTATVGVSGINSVATSSICL